MFELWCSEAQVNTEGRCLWAQHQVRHQSPTDPISKLPYSEVLSFHFSETISSSAKWLKWCYLAELFWESNEIVYILGAIHRRLFSLIDSQWPLRNGNSYIRFWNFFPTTTSPPPPLHYRRHHCPCATCMGSNQWSAAPRKVTPYHLSPSLGSYQIFFSL